MSEAKGPYFEKEDYSVHSMNAAYAEGFKAGRASRDGLREVLEGAQKFVIDQIAEIGACDHSVGHCECEVIRLAENIKKALEDDGEAGK